MAGRIPQAFIDDLLARVDIVDVIDERVPLRKAGKNYQALCPFHNEKTPSFTVSPDKQFYYCFGCGASGSALGFLMNQGKLEFVDAIHELAAIAGVQVPVEHGASAPTEQHQRLFDSLGRAEQYFSRQLREHAAARRAQEYLQHRGLNDEVAAQFGVGYAPPGWDNLLRALAGAADTVTDLERAGMLVRKDEGGHYDRFRDRVMFPIRDGRGRVIGFGGRVLGDEEPKYLNSPETPVFHKGRELYGLYQARRSGVSLEPLLVVEGYMDVLALAQFGVKNAVATLGTAATREHFDRLFRVTSDVVFCFDGDAAGRRAAWRALEVGLPLLGEGRRVGFIFLPEGEDPDTLVRKQGPAVFQDRERVTPLSDFLFDTLRAKVDLRTIEGRAQLVELVRPHLVALSEGPLQQLMCRRLASLAALDPEDILPAPKRAARQNKPRASVGRAGRASTRESLVRQAIRLLLHRPSLAQTVDDSKAIAEAPLAGAPLLARLIEVARESPHLTSGALIERWRGTEDGAHLSKLLTRPPPLPEDRYQREFSEVVKRLGEMRTRPQVPDRPSALSDAEKAALRRDLSAGKPAKGRA